MPASTATCARCGTPVPPGARACSSCGADVSSQQGQVATAYVAAGEVNRLSLAGTGLLDALRRATAGDYDVRGELGAGGMATVYLAHDLALDRKVAIKVMAPALLAIPGMVERFKREARTAANLSHPHVIPIFAVKQSAELVYFVMKYIEGRSLESIVHAAGALPVPLVQAVLYQAAAALGYANRTGVVHRDIKPANIMVDRDGWVVVTDFGIAKVAESQGLTMTGATIGTPSYMSPEQCEAKRELTGASDQYSLGVVAYEMLTGHLPFRADTTLGLLYAHVHETPAPVAEFRPDVPAAVADALMRMLAKDPAARFADVEAAAAALGGSPIGHDDPIRIQLRELARAGGADDIKRIASTPVSPVPATRAPTARPAPVPPPATATRTAARPAPARGGVPALLWLLPLAAVVGLGAVGLTLWRRARAPEPVVAAAPARPETVRVEVPVPAPPVAATPRTAPAQPGPGAALPPGFGDSITARVLATLGDSAQRLQQRLAVLQAAALAVRLRAQTRGASDADLQAGDALVRAADSLAQGGQVLAALQALRGAQQSWTEAEQGAAAPPPRIERFRAPGAAPERTEIEGAVAAFATAFQSRDLSRVRRVYPGMTPEQAQEWGDFFLDARDLDVRLSIASYESRGERVVTQLTGALDWQSLKTGRAESRAVSYQATFTRGVRGWRLVALR